MEKNKNTAAADWHGFLTWLQGTRTLWPTDSPPLSPLQHSWVETARSLMEKISKKHIHICMEKLKDIRTKNICKNCNQWTSMKKSSQQENEHSNSMFSRWDNHCALLCRVLWGLSDRRARCTWSKGKIWTTPSPISMFVGCFKRIPSLNRMLKLQIRMICLVDKHFEPIRVKSANFTCLLHSSGQHQGLHCDLQRINWIAALRLLRLLPNIIQ